MKEILNKFITLNAFINRNNIKLFLVWQAIKIINVLTFLFILLQNYLKSYFSNTLLDAPLTTVSMALSGRNSDGSAIV